MTIDVPKDRVAIIIDSEDITRCLVQGKADSVKNKEAIELAIGEEYCGDCTIQSCSYHSYTDTFTMVVHIWNNEEGGPPDIHDFTMQKSTLY